MSGWVRARSQVIFIIGLLLASGVVFWLDRQECIPVSDLEPAARMIVTPASQVRDAWSYFERNRNVATGLVHANESSGWTTLADAGFTIRATIAAHRLGLINGRELYQRLASILKTLGTVAPQSAAMRLDTRTARPSAVDPAPTIEPLETALELVAWSYPANSLAAERELARWRSAPRPAAAAVAQSTDAERNAMLLVRAAIHARGDHR